MIRERTDTTVFTGAYRGHMIVIRETVWDKTISERFPLLAKNYYCGYVELFPSDYYFNHLEEAEDNLDVFGGITYDELQMRKLPVLPQDKCFVGFDTAHAYQLPYSLETVKKDCTDLINQIEEANHGQR